MLDPKQLDEWIRGIIGDIDAGARETLATFMRRFVICDAGLALLGEVTPFGWSEWTSLEASISNERDPNRKADLVSRRDGIAVERTSFVAPLRDLLAPYRDLLFVIQHEHGGGGVLGDDSPARHFRRPILRRARLTALDAVERCPVLGVECVEAARTVLIRARDDLLLKLDLAGHRFLPETHALRQRARVERLDPELFTKDGRLRETARRILAALDEPLGQHKHVVTVTKLSLDEVKRFCARLKRGGLIVKGRHP
jgi:hypothetical protein